ncbi:MAG TPA: protein kinase [Bryobacteraceae bacterium]|jgi:Tol biopolymer transport system component
MPLAVGTKLGPYEILAPIGAGGMGEVYRAHDSRLGRDVALKVSSERFSDRFEREARAVAALNHPHICHLYDVSHAESGPDYLVMELVDGKPLAVPMPLSEALPLAIQIAEALEHAHRRGVVHRDLKPANILMTTKSGIKLLDFGLAKMGAASLSAHGLPAQDETATMGVVMGTPAYMSPEQWEGKPGDARSDIFSFGAVLYEMLTGKRAFEGATGASILASVMRDHPTGSAELTGPVEPVLRRCLAKDPDERFQTASDLKWALEHVGVAKAAAVEARHQEVPHQEAPFKVSKAAIVERFFLTLFFLLAAALGIAWFTQRPVEIPQLQFSLDPPPGTIYSGPYHATAISPDGTMIAFGAARSQKLPTLWVRALDSLEAKELPGTEDSNGPFFSPDGKSIGFFADGKLKRTEVGGGQPQVLCDAANEQGGDWGANGTILFSSDNTIQRVSAGGGMPQPVTSLDASRQESAHNFPQFLEDGQTFLYYVQSPSPATQGVYAARLDKPKGTRVLAVNARAVYAARSRGNPGELLWLRGNELVAQRFDSDTLRLDGEPVPVAPDIATTANAQSRAAFWAAPKGPLVYRAGGASTPQLAWVGRDGKSLQVFKQDTGFGPRLSPDGKRVAVTRNVSGNFDIWLNELDRGVITRLTFDAAQENYPVWSPDGRQIAFGSSRTGVFQMYRKDAGGTGAEERLHEGPNPEIPLDWSRDGKYLLYREENPNTRADLMILPLEGERKPIPFAQTPFQESFGAFSPDGKWIAYTSEESGQAEVYLRASPVAPGGGGANAAGKVQISSGAGNVPRWRGDSKELFYRAGPFVHSAGIRVVAGRPEVEAPQTFRATGPADFDVAADGQRLVMLAQPESSDANLRVISNWRGVLKK